MNVQRSKGKASGTVTEINCYFALIAWFLSLGGTYNSDGCVPFSIIGMQQVFQNGKLQLFVGVQPNETVYDVNDPPGKGLKNKIKAFNKAITKYLSTHSLKSVYQDVKKVFLRVNPVSSGKPWKLMTQMKYFNIPLAGTSLKRIRLCLFNQVCISTLLVLSTCYVVSKMKAAILLDLD